MDNEAINIIKKVFSVDTKDIKHITSLKKGMSNDSFVFECKGKKYIMRIPGVGTDSLIDRRKEVSVYNAIKDKNICDKVIYIDSVNGYKITEFIENAKTCNPNLDTDLIKCMKFLKSFHDMKLTVSHDFDLFEQIVSYENLLKDSELNYVDYFDTKEKVFSLKKYVDDNIFDKCLAHIDSVYDNFLIYKNDIGEEEIRLIDFEYAGIQDPHVDIAMFCIYALYDREQIDHLIDIYFSNECPKNIRIKIYCYIAICGLLWSNWCQYKKSLGLDFGDYAFAQYCYAKEYSDIAKNMMEGAYE